MAIAVALVAMPQSASAEARDIEIPSHDGLNLKATLWTSVVRGPAILLLHQCDLDRSMYRELGETLFASGFHVLSFDFRGLGESTNESFDLAKNSNREAWDHAVESFPRDTQAAYKFLTQSTNVDPERVGVLGASCGGRELITLALQNRRIQAFGFLSARLSERSVAQLERLAAKPMLFIASEGDRRAAAAARDGVEMSRHSASRLQLFEGNDHGYPLFAKHPQLVNLIVGWFGEQLK